MERKGPFGLWMGMTLEQVQGDPTDLGSGKYRVDSVPIPHSSFEFYVLRITPGQGLSWIKAVGKDIQSSVFGLELTAAFDAMEARLSTVYGQGQRTDFLLPDSIWNEPRDATQAFLSQERYLWTVWSPASGGTLKDDLSSVGLMLGVTDSSTGYLAVEYTFPNEAAAEAEVTAAEDFAL